MRPNFYYHPRMLQYEFGYKHPLKPERLKRTARLVERLDFVNFVDPGEGSREDVLRVHDPAYVDSVELISSGYFTPDGFMNKGGFGSIDNPPFIGMYEASLAYVAGVVNAANDVKDGVYRSFCMAGGLHHSMRSRAAGFCIFNDAAIALHILRERFDRVAYVDIDVHHGDGVQQIWFDDPNVLTCSIHEDGRTLFPGTGSIDETGAHFTSLNVPLEAKTTGEVWLWAFNNTIIPAVEAFRPQAIVLQLGTDIHYLDPLGHIKATAQEWLGAVEAVNELGIPIAAVGGGGYNLTTVPRMWTAACLTLCGLPVPCDIPEDLAIAWEMPHFFDEEAPVPRGSGWFHAEDTVDAVLRNVLPFIPRS